MLWPRELMANLEFVNFDLILRERRLHLYAHMMCSSHVVRTMWYRGCWNKWAKQAQDYMKKLAENDCHDERETFRSALAAASMRKSRKFCQRGSKFDPHFFLVDGGKEDPNTTLIGPSSACQRNPIEMVFRWQVDDGPTLSTGLVALWIFSGSEPVLLRNPIFLWFFRRAPDPPPPPPPLDPPSKLPGTCSCNCRLIKNPIMIMTVLWC